MKAVILGSTGISSPQNAFGALPIQRDDFETAVQILRRAYDGGMTFYGKESWRYETSAGNFP